MHASIQTVQLIVRSKRALQPLIIVYCLSEARCKALCEYIFSMSHKLFYCLLIILLIQTKHNV